ncbi:MAG: hypothetical protein ABEJ69_00495 [Candidatus Nanohaloarchaea archaeon]
MVLEALLGIGREVVSQSWTAAAVLSKYLVLFVLGRLVYEKRLTVEDLREELLKYSRPTVYALVVSGAVLAFTGITLEPVFLFFSQVVALAYLGFLFWSY